MRRNPRESVKPIPSTGTGTFWKVAAILAITFIVYIPAVHGDFVWDDDEYVADNVLLHDLGGLVRIWFEPGASVQYYPLSFTTFLIEYHLWGLNPVGYHLTNILLQGIDAVLLWLILRRLAVPGAWFAAAVFAVHPVNVESVAWITERKNVLCGLFYFATVLAFLRYANIDPRPSPLVRSWRWYAVTAVLFVCSLMSKSTACTLPAALILVLWWKRDRLTWRDIVPLIPMLVLSAAMALTTAWVETTRVGAVGHQWSLSWLERSMVASRVLWFYAGKLLWPHPVIFIYPRWQVDPSQAWQYLFGVATVAVLLVSWLARGRIGKGPLVGVLYFAGTLAPAMGFANVYFMQYSFVADHFQYLASLGLIALFVSAGWAVGLRLPPFGRRAAAALAGCLLLALGIGTWRQAHAYANLETLWRDTLTKNPKAWLAYNNLGARLLGHGDIPQAIVNLREALRLNPNYAEAHVNIGLAFARQGQTEEALAQYNQALAIDPHLAEANTNLGDLFADLGRFDEAIACQDKALQAKPTFVDAYRNRGRAFDKMGLHARAIQDYTKAIELAPDSAYSYFGRALVHLHEGDFPQTVKDCTTAIALKPDYAEAYNMRGTAFGSMHDFSRTIQDCTQAISLKPNYAEAYNNRAIAFVQSGELARALSDYAKALELNPQDPDAYNNRAFGYLQLKEYDKAWADVRTCRRLGGQPSQTLLNSLMQATSRAE